MQPEKSIGIFGAGPGALTVADRLTRKGFKVSNFFSEGFNPSNRSVFTTTVGYPGMVVTEACPPTVLRSVDELRVFTSARNDFTAGIKGYYMVDYPAFITDTSMQLRKREEYVPEIYPSGVLSAAKINEKNGAVEITLDGGKQEFDFVIDATGPRARIARQVENNRRNENPVVEYVYGGQYYGRLSRNQMILVIGVNGGTCWINPSAYDQRQIDIVFSAWGWLNYWNEFIRQADLRLEQLVEFATTIPGVHLKSPQPVSVFSGMIRSQPVPKPYARHTFSVGEAAGNAKPGTGESFNRTIYSARLVADAVQNSGNPGEVYEILKRKNRDYPTVHAAILARMKPQLRGQLGDAFNEFARRYGNADLTEADILLLENYFIRGKLHPKLISMMLNTSSFRKVLMEIVKKRIKTGIYGEDIETPFWSLPEI